VPLLGELRSFETKAFALEIDTGILHPRNEKPCVEGGVEVIVMRGIVFGALAVVRAAQPFECCSGGENVT